MEIIDRLFVHDKGCFDYSYEEMSSYLARLGDAEDDFDRSYKQYRAQAFFLSGRKSALLNVASSFLYIPVLLSFLLKGLFYRGVKEKRDAVARLKETDLFVPDSVLDGYDIDRNAWNEPGFLNPGDFPYLLSLTVKYFFHPFFLMKNMIKLCHYSGMIEKYSPSAIIVSDEFSFTSSILTNFCERHQVSHLNVQHGEKLFNIRDSYFRFTKFYIWDVHYRDLFVSMKAFPGQFIEELPLSMKFDTSVHFKEQYYADYKYYLAIYDEEQIKSIVDAMQFARKQGKTVKYRPHPNYSDISLLRKYVGEEEIEDCRVDILTSVSSLSFAVGLYSTVLNQAFINGKQVILDDVTFPKEYASLLSLKYILANKNLASLSQYKDI